ncbi:hypothetical protein IV203_009933 [Nitzschia inconspicua]|uniref:Uncharacterized protein n=1 Tax=Nitzschia inconspicua TaxID=303405 RepID=A0A9K3KV77_9STRA|nr:hypothetical protein IV203_009933 [Nitzschia inconspicua]
MDAPTDDTESNPYLALRAAKIARNEARLKELGLWKQPQLTTSQPSSFTRHTPKKKGLASSLLSDSDPVSKKSRKTVTVGNPRRSARISGQDGQPNYKEDTIVDKSSNGRTSIPTEDAIHDRKKQPSEDSPGIRKERSPSLKVQAPPKANSVRQLSLDMTTLVRKYLGQSMECSGKEFVIHESFRVASDSKEVLRRLKGAKLSFNKYCGVQQWRNCAFLWVNMGNNGASNSVANDFLEDGRLVTWFGGSRMDEQSPIIQTLFDLGKEAADKIPVVPESGIVLWCRKYDGESKKFGPYVCLGRLAYHSHVPGSYPVAFTWKLLDYEALMGSSDKRKLFQSIMNS